MAYKHLVDMACGVDGVMGIAAGLVLRVPATGLRFAHVSRALIQMDKSDDRMCVIGISRGKSRGRQSFTRQVQWGGQQGQVRGVPLLLQLQKDLEATIGKDARRTLVPDLALGGGGITGKGGSVVRKHMPYSRFADVLRTVLTLRPLSLTEDEASRYPTYALRRFLLSVAEVLGMPLERRNSLGNWVDNVSDDKGARPKGSEPMAVRYRAARFLSSAQVKRACLAAVSHLQAHGTGGGLHQAGMGCFFAAQAGGGMPDGGLGGEDLGPRRSSGGGHNQKTKELGTEPPAMASLQDERVGIFVI